MDAIAEIRAAAANVQQQALCDLLGTSRSTLWEIVSGKQASMSPTMEARWVQVRGEIRSLPRRYERRTQPREHVHKSGDCRKCPFEWRCLTAVQEMRPVMCESAN